MHLFELHWARAQIAGAELVGPHLQQRVKSALRLKEGPQQFACLLDSIQKLGCDATCILPAIFQSDICKEGEV